MNNVGLGVLGTAAVYGLVKLGQYWNADNKSRGVVKFSLVLKNF